MNLVCVSGNTGSGKSTLIGPLVRRLDERAKTIALLEDAMQPPRVGEMLRDQQTWALVLQLSFLVERASALIERAGQQLTVVMERSLAEDAVFFTRFVDHGMIRSSLTAPYAEVRDAVESLCPPPVGYVYLDCPPEICLSRLKAASVSGARPVHISYDDLERYVLELDASYRTWRRKLDGSIRVFDLRVAEVDGPSAADLDECVDTVWSWIVPDDL